MTAPDRTLAIVGGGRWARVYLSLLSRIDLPIAEVAVVSQHGGDGLAAALAEANARGKRCFTHLSTLDEGLTRANVFGAIVVNSARDHARTARRFMERNIPALLEKPVALTTDEAEYLISASTRFNVVLMPAHVLQFCSYLHEFARVAGEALDTIQSIDIRWRDPAGETRYGEAKSFDSGIGVVEEIAPHIATLLQIVAGGASHSVDKIEFSRGGLAAGLRGRWNNVPYSVLLERQSAGRERVVVLGDGSGRKARLDFSVEPGTISVGSISRPADDNWSQRASPLTQQLLKFIEIAPGGKRQEDIHAIRYTSAFTVSAARLVRNAQARWLFSSKGRDAAESDCLVALKEVLAPSLVDAALVSPGDNRRLEELAQEAMLRMAGREPPRATPGLEEVLQEAKKTVGLNA